MLALLFCGACQCEQKPTCVSADCAKNYASFLRHLPTNSCARLFACGVFDPGRPVDCEKYFLRQDPSLSTAQVKVAIGSLSYDPVAGQRCLEATLVADCPTFPDTFPFVPECSALFRPSAATGERCIDPSDCATAGDTCPKAACESTCQRVFDAGSSCTTSAQCQGPLSCDAVLQTCQVAGSGGLNEPCTNDLRKCSLGNICSGLGGAGASGRCTSVAAGDPCQSDGGCGGILKCGDAGLCVHAGDCATSADCLTSMNCSEGHCVGALVAGTPFDPASSLETCASPTACLPSIDFKTWACQVRLREGAPCRNFPDEQPELCLLPYVCMDGHCAHVRGIGEHCSNFCLDGWCTDDGHQSGEFRCNPKLGLGQTCPFSTACESGNCSGNSTCVEACP